MSEFVEEDWKLKAHAEVKLRRENTNMLVLEMHGEIFHFEIFKNFMKFFKYFKTPF